MMNVLVVYSFDYTQGIRNTILESIFCFRDYEDVHFYHYNYDVKMRKMLYLLRKVKFDAVLFHYAFICEMRWGEKSKHEKILQDFKNCWPEAVKGIIPQDEYYMPSRTGRFIQEAGINIVYTLASGKNIGILYSEYLKNVKVYTVLTGYVDMNTLKKVERLKKEFKGRERQYRIGYRGRSVNYALGKIGNIKTSMVDEFNKRLKDYPIATNIMNTGDDKNVFWGDDWYRFLLNCDTVLGCMSGASIVDRYGKIANMVMQYLQKHPTADFAEVSEKILGPYENNIDYTGMSPRIFEAAMTRTCQVLAEGDYKIVKPGIHYISFKSDFSDFDEVMKKIEDKKYCQQIAENAYQELIQSGKYTYQRYVRKVVKTLKKEKMQDKSHRLGYIKVILRIYDLIQKQYNRLYKILVRKGWIWRT